jgi:protoporphyrin/coproporphyrin ferrochelatase
MTRVAIVLFNLGGPDSPEAIPQFLRNLFADPVILGLPQPFRSLLGSYIAWKRVPVAKENYGLIGGRSPLLPQTEDQAEALAARMAARRPEIEFRSFVCMRYWHPMAAAVVAEVKAWAPDKVIVLPLYPQYSITTSGSSMKDWRDFAAKAKLDCPHVAVCCYPTLPGWVSAVAAGIEDALGKVDDPSRFRVIFSAHGLPKAVVDRGDPYPRHVEASVEAVVETLHRPDMDWVLAYQSKVGPQTWIGPATEDVIAEAGAEGKSLLVVPIAFVSEHSETLVELDIDYRDRAKAAGVPEYLRVPTVQCDPRFIGGLSDLVDFALGQDCAAGEWVVSGDGCRKACTAAKGKCAMDDTKR